MKKLISIVIPAYNEEPVIPHLAKRLARVMDAVVRYEFEVIVTEHGSTDDTIGALLKAQKKDHRFKIVQLSKNEGCDGGILAALSFAKGDAAIIMMADLQDTPELIPTMIQQWEKGFDIVSTKVKKRVGIAWSRRFGTWLFYKLMHWLTRGALLESVSDFRLMDRCAYRVIVAMPEHHKFFRGLATWVGFRTKVIEFDRPNRVAGYSKATFREVVAVAQNGVLSFSYFPLYLPWIATGVFGFVSVLIFIFVHDSFLFSLFFLATLFSVMMAFEHAYIVRILEEVRGRPNFIVKKTHGL